MTQPRITIIGLGLIGGSIGLGLTSSAKSVLIVGHDRDIGQSKLAQKRGMVHSSKMNLLDACQDADLVVIATPITAIRETLEWIGPHLKPGCVVTDTASLKEPVLAWAAELLPEGVSFVGGDPLLNPSIQFSDLVNPQRLDSVRGDLFQNALYFLCAPPETPPTAVKRVTDMVNLLQARPFYVDAIEHDGMRAATEEMPALIGLALMQTASESPGWREARKLAGHAFGMTTAPLAGDAATQRAQILLNADRLLPRLDEFIHKLARLREWMAEKDAAALEAALEQAISVRSHWLADRVDGKWEEELSELGISGTFGSLGSGLGFGSRTRKPKEK